MILTDMKRILNWNDYEAKAREAIAEGCVLLKNENQALPLAKGSNVAVFGRIQSSYYKSGTGSGGKVNVAKVWNIVEGLEESGQVEINQYLKKVYEDWIAENPFDEGLGWGQEKWSQDEMPLTEEIVKNAAKDSDTAIVILGRTAGEDKDNSATAGSYLLSELESDMIKKVRAGFKKVVVLLNVGNIIDMSFVDEYKPDAVMYVWQGGMLGGLGTADVLVGKVSPCGKLPDTIANQIADYPSDKWFGNLAGNSYCEDIFVGYRYFETFAKDKVRFPFGFGLSYTTFDVSDAKIENDEAAKTLKVSAKVTNTGKVAGKEVVQIYVQAPNGKLGKASRVLVDFGKTETLEPGKSETLAFEVPYYAFASYDDAGVTGNKSAWVLEKGDYTVYAGTDVRSAAAAGSFNLANLLLIKQCEEALAPVKAFDRMHATEDGKLVMEPAPLSTVDMWKRRAERIPEEIKQTGGTDIQLKDVLNGTKTMKEFISQLTDEDLCCLARGEGMGSSLVTPGTASAFGGVSPRLRDTFGVPVSCCDDGPSGMRLDCGMKAFSLPNGTSLACSFNRKLVKELYAFTGLEMCSNKVENLLGPGMNIHRHPLNGRNFEYFSEDPFLTGEMGSAMIQGLQSSGVTGTAKHFCGNNQEAKRYEQDSVMSERALREIYLKGFEIAVSKGADSLMTTYGMVNSIYTASNYDLNTTILRKDWGFTGILMTDWWANLNEPGVAPNKSNLAAMIRSQNDMYMCCSDGSRNADGDNLMESLENGKLSRGELQRSAINVCNHVMNTEAMKRLTKTNDEVEVINRPVYSDDVSLDDVEMIVIEKDKETVIDLTYQESNANTNYILAFDYQTIGTYEMTLTGSSELGELAQLPCTLLFQGIPIASFTFNGTNGKEVSIKKEMPCPTRFSVCRLFVASNGLKLKDLRIKYVSDVVKFPWM